MRFLLSLGETWASWLATIAICLGLVAAAVYYQEVLMHYPCELCIYTRVWLVAMALFAVVGLVLRNTLWPLRIVLLIEMALALGLMRVVWRLLGIEYAWGEGGACSMVANFPSWARLDEWLPVVFKVQGSCAATPLVVFNISMADALAAISVGFFLAFALALYGSLQKRSS